MARLPSKSLPDKHQRILLVHPTKYLGNLLITGNLIQEYFSHCKSHKQTLFVVIDEKFRILLKDVMPAQNLIYYPRQKIQSSSGLQRVFHFLSFLKKIRALKIDLAFNLEEDAVTNRLTQYSGAKFKLGCSKQRHRRKYDHVLPISYIGRPKARAHRWHCYYEIFAFLGLPEPKLRYMKLAPGLLTLELQTKLKQHGIDFSSPVIAMHAGASNEYKKWPLLNFVKLAESLSKKGYQSVFIGTGVTDKSASRAILHAVENLNLQPKVIDLVDQLNLSEVASFLVVSAGMVGNDSGPFHLASALGLPGCVIFGPTDRTLWAPLSPSCQVMSGSEACDPECLKSQCPANYRCLHSITYNQVFDKITLLLDS